MISKAFFLVWSLSLSVGQGLPSCQNATLLQTLFGAFKAHGNMFDVSNRALTRTNNCDDETPTAVVWITGMDVALQSDFLQKSPFTVNVLTKEGTHVGFENDIAAWTVLHSQPDVTTSDILCSFCSNNRLNDLLRLEFAAPLSVNHNTTQAFYLTVADVDNNMVVFGDGRATNGPGTVVVQDDYLVIHEGVVLPSYFGLSISKEDNTFTGGIFSGKIHYLTSCDTPTMEPPTPSELMQCPRNETTTVTLPTAQDAKYRTHGIMWDLTAAGGQDIVVSELRIPIDAEAPTFDFDILQLWTKEGSLVGFESDPSPWTTVLAESVDYPSYTNTFSDFWSLPLVEEPLLIPAGETRAFYVTTFGDENEYQNFVYSAPFMQDEAIDANIGPITAFDANVEIGNAVALESFFGGGTDPENIPAFWNGIVVYDVCTPSSSSPGTTPQEAMCPETYNIQDQIVSFGLEESMQIIRFDTVFAIDAYVESLLLVLNENLYGGDSLMVSVWTTSGLLDQADADLSTWDIVFRSSITIDFSVWLPTESFRRASVPADQSRSFAVGFLLLGSQTPLYAGGGIRPGEWAVRTPDLLVRESGSVFSGALQYSSCNLPRRFVPQCGDGDTAIQAVTTVPPVFNPLNLLVVSGPQGGVMFDVQASESIEVRSLDTRFRDPDNLSAASGIVSVWTKPGSYVGFENDQTAWDLLFRHEVRFSSYSPEDLYYDLALGLNARLPVEDFRPKIIPAGSTQAFYVTMHADTTLATPVALPVDGSPGTLIGDDGTVRIFSGLALSEQFGGILSGGNGFFGYINYRRCLDMSSGQASVAAADMTDKLGLRFVDDQVPPPAWDVGTTSPDNDQNPPVCGPTKSPQVPPPL